MQFRRQQFEILENLAIKCQLAVTYHSVLTQCLKYPIFSYYALLFNCICLVPLCPLDKEIMQSFSCLSIPWFSDGFYRLLLAPCCCNQTYKLSSSKANSDITILLVYYSTTAMNEAEAYLLMKESCNKGNSNGYDKKWKIAW